MAASRGGGYALLYTPNGIPFEAVPERLEAPVVAASCFDPLSGGWAEAGTYVRGGIHRFVPPSSGRGEDWVLLLEAKGENL
ncbi:putative collagen-binding domain-containing protein [Paenibacillus sacheonensis]|uniref:Putative collagen-binding domain-containing protein n=1 Tax=Paenibacillus sacheonensis TaxID=742054 RepID=A0A7X4YJU1_9BACL|nr:putative collagen-binding domain-containing protein [Paenibacillus sacheonensis]MBM7563956.1 hypothetical protein [Paenibacillus sacheonensis]NBC67702.1 hypothetical protein [Paenibacillus sacheonensis]